MTYMVMPQHKNPWPGEHEIYYLGRPFLGHHYYVLIMCEPCLRVTKIFLKKYNNFSLYPKLTSPLGGVGSDEI